MRKYFTPVCISDSGSLCRRARRSIGPTIQMRGTKIICAPNIRELRYQPNTGPFSCVLLRHIVYLVHSEVNLLPFAQGKVRSRCYNVSLRADPSTPVGVFREHSSFCIVSLSLRSSATNAFSANILREIT